VQLTAAGLCAWAVARTGLVVDMIWSDFENIPSAVALIWQVSSGAVEPFGAALCVAVTRLENPYRFVATATAAADAAATTTCGLGTSPSLGNTPWPGALPHCSAVLCRRAHRLAMESGLELLIRITKGDRLDVLNMPLGVGVIQSCVRSPSSLPKPEQHPTCCE
jgi:hypothetical protein